MAATIPVNTHNLDTKKYVSNKLKLIVSKSFDFQANFFIWKIISIKLSLKEATKHAFLKTLNFRLPWKASFHWFTKTYKETLLHRVELFNRDEYVRQAATQ